MERRRAPRRQPEASEASSLLRLRGGREVTVLDISVTGVLVEGAARLLPGTFIDMHVSLPAARLLVRGRVVRAYVSAVSADALRYRTGLAFDHPLEGDGGYDFPGPRVNGRRRAGMGYPPTIKGPDRPEADAAPTKQETRRTPWHRAW